jgi:hypothetical protein
VSTPSSAYAVRRHLRVTVASRARHPLIFAALDGLSLQQLLYSDPVATDEALRELHELLAEFAVGRSGCHWLGSHIGTMMV